jgi:sugar lactone lactonase YvrE
MLSADFSNSSGKGVAYLTDASASADSGIIVVDLGTGDSWRHLDADESVSADKIFLTIYDDNMFVPVSPVTGKPGHLSLGADGLAISADGSYIYYTPLASRRWYRVPTQPLRVPTQGDGAVATAAAAAKGLVEYLGTNPSHFNGLESDASDIIYMSAPERNSIYSYNPSTSVVQILVRDELIQWPDTLHVANQKLYFIVNQFWL